MHPAGLSSTERQVALGEVVILYPVVCPHRVVPSPDRPARMAGLIYHSIKEARALPPSDLSYAEYGS